ncbi:hypothetical protein AB0L57_05600 [Nocardia sp. NPDC052254]|uniref:hypothetical protein n=1 Tax=Nocardia sp. NPDC052254 TaxID=3155681 RepID=UPI00342D07C8
MSYDHVLLPAGAAASPDAVEAYLAGQQGQAETEIVATIAAELDRRNDELPEQDGFLGAAAGDAGAGTVLHITAPYDAIGHVRALLFELATPHDYAIYDPQLNWLIDPTGRIDVTVTHGGAGEFPYLTEKLARQWVPELCEPNPYLIVERDDQIYIQTYRDEPGLYMLEYRDGGPDRHFGTQLADGDRVAELIWEWTAGERARLDALDWEPVSL